MDSPNPQIAGPRAPIVDAAGDHAHERVHDAARQHDHAGHGHCQKHAVLVELRQDVHGGKGDAEVDHHAHGTHAESLVGEDAHIDDGHLHGKLAANIERKAHEARNKPAQNDGGCPSARARHSRTEHNAAEAHDRKHDGRRID